MTQTTELLTAGVEILHLEDYGYGPNGSMKREDWRAACLKNLLAGKEQFEAWQRQVLANHRLDGAVSFSLRLESGEKFVSEFITINPCTLDFSGHKFENGVNAYEFEFLLSCQFNSATFSGEDAWFEGATFSGDVTFDNAIFNQVAFFNRANFSMDAGFHRCIFKDAAMFHKAIFCSNARFGNTIFNQIAWFTDAKFQGGARFSKAMFAIDSVFEKASFHKDTDFESAVFTKTGDFVEARFLKLPPNFRGAKSDSTRLEFSDESYFPKNYSPDEDVDVIVRNISTLKRLSDEHGQADQALNFNAMELQAKRLLPDATWTFKTVTWLYEVISNYGRSFAKPFGIYAALLFLTFLIALEHSADIVPRDTPARQMWAARVTLEDPNPLKLDGVRAAFEYTLFRAAGVLDFSDSGKHTEEVALRLFGQKIEPWYMRIWGVFKAIASTALLFLAALGLRNKYRIK